MAEVDERKTSDQGRAERHGAAIGSPAPVGDASAVGDATGLPLWPLVMMAAAWLGWIILLFRIAVSNS